MKSLNEENTLRSMALFSLQWSVWGWKRYNVVDGIECWVSRNPIATKTAAIIAHDRILNDQLDSKGLPSHK